VVTGANAGLGLETVRGLALLGASVVMGSRDVERGEVARASVLTEVPEADLVVEQLDLSSLTSVRDFAQRVMPGGVDMLFNNAGIMALPHTYTQDGFEAQFGVNHLEHFALTTALMPALRERPGARVVATTSAAAWSGRINFDDLMGERGYGRWRAYTQSKLANLLFVRALTRRMALAGIDGSAHAAHPGLVFTDLQRNVSRLAGAGGGRGISAPERFFLESLTPFLGQDAQMGALPQLYAALSPAARPGDLWGPRWFNTRGRPIVVNGPASGHDQVLQERLWAVSAELVGAPADEMLG